MTAFRSRFYKPALVAVALALFCSAHFTQRHLNVARGQLGLTRVAPLENAPPVLAFTTVALGGFRGLIANVLWIRASELQDEDKFFEMVQLADWITKLQPHFTTVWIHLAWNMAYNISIKFTDPKDRWAWVMRGIELLRDEGLRYNPNEPLLYRELAWFFQHKMGHYLDDAHDHDKQYWAAEMTQVLGPGRPNFEELIHPPTDEAKARTRRLREHYKMDPVWMKEVDERYGPLEWRLPETHAIYWAVVGLEKTQNEQLKKEDFITLRRVIFQSMQLAFHRGRLIFPNKAEQEFLYGPNLEIVRQTNKAYEEMIELEPDKRDHLGTGHKNFLKTAVYFLYSHNRMTAAQEWFKYVLQKYPGSVPANMDLDQYAISRVTEDVGETDPNRIKALLEGLLESSLLSYAIGDDDQAAGYELFTRRIWDRYQTAIGKVSKDRVGLPPLPQMRQEALNRVLGPEFGLDPVLANQLRTKLNLPAPAGSTTNLPPTGAPPATNAPPAAAGRP